MALFFPALVGFGLLTAFLLGGKKDGAPLTPAEEEKAKEEIDAMTAAEKEALVKAAEAVKKQDWQTAISEALKLAKPSVLRELAAKMKKAGEKDAAAELLALAKELENKQKGAAKPKPVLAKPKPAPTVSKPDDAKKKAEAAKKEKELAEQAKKQKAAEAKKRAEREAAEAKKKAEEKKKADAAKKKPTEADLKRGQAEELKKHLSGTSRYKENQTYVKNYQANNGLTQDGKYGPATARSFWSKYKLVPVNPFYWPSTGVAKETAAYSAFLDSIKADAPKHTAEVDKLKKTVGK